jgi:hypothetical protein
VIHLNNLGVGNWELPDAFDAIALLGSNIDRPPEKFSELMHALFEPTSRRREKQHRGLVNPRQPSSPYDRF